MKHPTSAYTAGAPVGKSLVQVGKAQDNSIISNNAEVFEKWSQALSSAHDLADEATRDGERHNSAFSSMIFPILIVPDGTLWSVHYSASGIRKGTPVRVDQCSFFVGRNYAAGDRMRGTTLTISHLEFVTLAGLESLMDDIVNQGNSWFPSLDTSGTAAKSSHT